MIGKCEIEQAVIQDESLDYLDSMAECDLSNTGRVYIYVDPDDELFKRGVKSLSIKTKKFMYHAKKNMRMTDSEGACFVVRGTDLTRVSLK